MCLSWPFWYQSADQGTRVPMGWYVKTAYMCLTGLWKLFPGAISW